MSPVLPMPNLTFGFHLRKGQYLTSPSQKYFFGIFPTSASAGMLGVYAGSVASPTGTSLALHDNVTDVTMQSDGNLCASAAAVNVWCTMTQGQNNTCVMQDDGNFCVYRPDGADAHTFLWGSLQHGGKTSGFGPMPLTHGIVTLHNNFGSGEVCVEWNGGAGDYTALGSKGNSFQIAFDAPAGTSCWMRCKWGNLHQNSDSSQNFIVGATNVVYNLNTGPGAPPSWELVSPTPPAPVSR